MKKNKLIKVCGMKDGDNIREVEQLGTNMIGLIFYSHSPRCIREIPAYLPQKAKRVGVFVNEEVENVIKTANRFFLDYVQLHGSESAEYCLILKDAGIRIIKNFPIADEKDLEQTSQYEGICDYFLFDTKCKQHGGSGNPFDWNILHHYTGQTLFLLSGGIRPDSIEALEKFNHPQLAGYDINSQFEITPGEKDIKKIANFIKQIRK